MKKILLMLLKVFAILVVQAQVPAEINYQGVARNPGGVALANQDITLRLSIRSNSATGALEFQETRKVKTNNFGLFNIAIGSAGAMNVTGNLNNVKWSDGNRRYVQVEIDPNAGYSFKNMGSAQLLSVPYALYAASAPVADSAITTSKIKDSSVTSSKIKSGSVAEVTLADNAVSTAKLQNESVTTEKLANNAVSNAKIQNSAVTNVKIADNAVTTAKIENSAVTNPKLAVDAVGTSNIQNGAITADKIAPGVIVSGTQPTGSAGGDLSGNYPNPSLASQSVTNSKIANGAVITPKIADGAVTTNKVADGAITSAKLAPGLLSGLTLPYTNSQSATGNLFAITNSAASPAVNATAIKGAVTGNGTEGFGVWGSHATGGTGVYGTSANGAGLFGKATAGNGVLGTATSGVGVFGTSDQGLPGLFNISNTNNFNDALFASNSGYGNGIVALSTYSNGVLGIANDLAGAGIFGINNAGGEGVVGRGFSDFAAAVVGRNDGTYAGVKAVNAATNGTALLAELEGPITGNIAVFQANGVNVARIDHTGKAFFNNSTQVGGADVAEFFAVEGNRDAYEPGDVLVISTTSDRTVEKSSEAYSNLVSGVYATKAGLLLTEENAEVDNLDHLVPMGVIGVIPVKVNLEGGAIKRGDMLVTSSQTGVAMKGDLEKIKVGQVIGKALQDFNGSGSGKINVLVSIK